MTIEKAHLEQIGEAVCTELKEAGAPPDVAESFAKRIRALAEEIDLQHAREHPAFDGIAGDQVTQIILGLEYEAAAIVRRVTVALMIENFKLELELRKLRQRRR